MKERDGEKGNVRLKINKERRRRTNQGATSTGLLDSAALYYSGGNRWRNVVL